MIGDEAAQAAIVAKIKATSSITSLLVGGASEVREIQWQGDTFTYPNIRVDLEINEFSFDEQERCNLQYVEFSVYVFSQERSSKECSQIKTAIINGLVGIGFTNATQGVKFSRLRLVDNVPAIREDIRTWRSQAKFGSRITSP